MISQAPNLAPNYAEARQRFLAAAAPHHLNSYVHPLKGPKGEELALDAVWIGPKAPQTLLIIGSATHGAEGAAGSMVQTGLLEAGLDLPPHTACLMLHAINPHGFAWNRRVTENNVDLNRNFLRDFSAPPSNTAYDQLHGLICPTAWTGETQAAARAAMREFGNTHGAAALQAALTQGQYLKPDGVYFGGTGPEWSNITLHQILAELPSSIRRVLFIDIHTGLGPFGVGELILEIPLTDPRAQTMGAILGPGVTSTVSGDCVSSELSGPMDFGIERAFPDAEVLFTALEFGTLSPNKVFAAVQADNWLHSHGDPFSPAADPIKADIRAAFRPDAPEWANAVWQRSHAVILRALKCDLTAPLKG